jgi:hypothetical protein
MGGLPPDALHSCPRTAMPAKTKADPCRPFRSEGLRRDLLAGTGLQHLLGRPGRRSAWCSKIGRGRSYAGHHQRRLQRARLRPARPGRRSTRSMPTRSQNALAGAEARRHSAIGARGLLRRLRPGLSPRFRAYLPQRALRDAAERPSPSGFWDKRVRWFGNPRMAASTSTGYPASSRRPSTPTSAFARGSPAASRSCSRPAHWTTSAASTTTRSSPCSGPPGSTGRCRGSSP